MSRRVRCCVAIGALLGVATPGVRVGAQAPMPVPASGDALARADSLVAAGDTVAGLGLLQSYLDEKPGDAAAWHRQGELALRLARPAGSGFKWNAQTIRYMQLADQSLATASYLAPDSGRYQLTRAAYFLAGEQPMVREGAGQAYRRGLAAAQRAQDSAVISELAIELGLWYWRTYDGMANRRRIGLDVPLHELISGAETRRDLDHLVETYFPKEDRSSGELDHLRASELFLIALRVRPVNARAWFYSYLSLLALDAWEELESATRVRLHAAPEDAWAWMTSGLALHRQGKSFPASRSFERGIALLSEKERTRLTRLTRLLRPDDSARVASLSPPEGASTELLFWMIADPLSLTAENEHWLEFLSRVTYAELIFTVEEFAQRGADSPRGEVFIRYGPPRESIGSGPSPEGDYLIWWRYANGLEFQFSLYGPTRVVNELKFAPQRAMYEKHPYSFDGVPVARSMDTIPIAISRFRATADSADVFIAANIPLPDLASGVDLRSGTVQVGFMTFTGAATLLQRDTAALSVRLDQPRTLAPLQRTWTERFASADMGYRVEAYQVESGKAARALGAVPLGRLSGFGMSDVLIADIIQPARPTPERWTDLSVTPSFGTIRQGRDLALAWETYELAADSTQSSAYSVEIALERTDGSRLGRAIARVLGGTLGRGEGRGRDDRVAVSFDRRVPARPVTLDYLTLDLDDLDPGTYRLTITVTDAVRNVSAGSVRELVIVK